MNKKVTIIGAGNVGATVADVVAKKNIVNEVVLIDIKPNFAEGKALDIWESSHINYFDTKVKGFTDDYSKTADSDVVVITSGVPRKPGMSRDDLIGINAKIMKDVSQKAFEYSPNAKFIIVANPLDVMTYTAFLSTGLPRTQVFGMAGVLDTARFEAFIAETLNVSPRDVKAMLLGGHGDTMVPLPRLTSVSGIPLPELMDNETIEKLVERTKKGGGEIVNLLGTSGWYAPGAAAAQMVEAIVKDQKRIFPVCTMLDGEYGMNNIALGVPVKLGKNGIEEILELKLNDAEMTLLQESSEHVKGVMKILDDMKLF